MTSTTGGSHNGSKRMRFSNMSQNQIQRKITNWISPNEKIIRSQDLKIFNFEINLKFEISGIKKCEKELV